MMPKKGCFYAKGPLSNNATKTKRRIKKLLFFGFQFKFTFKIKYKKQFIFITIRGRNNK